MSRTQIRFESRVSQDFTYTEFLAATFNRPRCPWSVSIDLVYSGFQHGSQSKPSFTILVHGVISAEVVRPRNPFWERHTRMQKPANANSRFSAWTAQPLCVSTFPSGQHSFRQSLGPKCLCVVGCFWKSLHAREAATCLLTRMFAGPFSHIF